LSQLYVEPLRDLVKYREVLQQLLVRDLRIRHKHTKLGFLWSLLNPILQLGVLTAVFTKMTALDVRDYPVFAFSGLLPWMFFQASWLVGAYSYIDNQALLRRAFLPRVIFPLGRVLVRFIDYLVATAALSVAAVFFGYQIGLVWLALPFAIVLLFLFSLGVSMLAAVVSVYIRDFLHLQTVLSQVVYLATPIIYPATALPPTYGALIAYNPVYCVIQLFQSLIHQGRLPDITEWASAGVVAIITLTLGLLAIRTADNDLVLRI